MLDVPIEVNKEDGVVTRKKTKLDIVADKYDEGSEVPLGSILDSIFYEHGRVRPHERIMCFFPKFLEYFRQSHTNLVEKQDSLPVTTKLYLGIMAVSCYNCEYLLNILEEQFVLNGGDYEWIIGGLKVCDPKVAMFAELNELLAFLPFKLSVEHVQPLLRGPDGPVWSF